MRTIDAGAARTFYSDLLGHDRAVIWPLHEQARARGAMPHWLGHIDVGDVSRLEQIANGFVDRGAVRLGPTLATADRGHFLVLRDPGGAVVAIAAPAQSGAGPGIKAAWHVLNTNDLAAAKRNYGDLFGWSIAENALIGPHGPYHEFSWNGTTQERIGALADIADRPSVHPHWLFFFEVESLHSAVDKTRNAGGTALDPFDGPSGAQISVCEDPQRAAFGLLERRV